MWTLCNTDLFFAGPVVPVELSCFPSVSLAETALGNFWCHTWHFLPSGLITIIYWLPYEWIGPILSHQVCSEAPGMSERRVKFYCQFFGGHQSSCKVFLLAESQQLFMLWLAFHPFHAGSEQKVLFSLSKAAQNLLPEPGPTGTHHLESWFWKEVLTWTVPGWATLFGLGWT